MKLLTTLIRNTPAFLCLGKALLASNAVARQKALKELIVGTWLFDSVYDQTQYGTEHDARGPGVRGIAIYDTTGHYSSQVIAANRSKTGSNNPRTPVGQAIARFGMYTVDEAAKTLTDHIERCTFPQWDGGRRHPCHRVPHGGRTKYNCVHPIQDPTTGPMMPHLFFKRAK
jgi:Lipocalin-like domain